jgi:hypothetical protein
MPSRLVALGMLVGCGAGSAACAALLGFDDGTLAAPQDDAEAADAGRDAPDDGSLDAAIPRDGDVASDAPSDATGDADAKLDAGSDAALDAASDASDAGDAGIDAGTKQAFETPLTFNGRLDANGIPGAGGLAAGDARCMEAAQATFPGRTFVAWLSTAGTSAASRLAGGGPWYVGDNLLGGLVELTHGTLKTPLHQGPTGVASPLPLGVWTGTSPDGTFAFAACVDWTSAASAAAGASGEIGTGGGANDTWTYATARGCDNLYHLYCFEK